MIGFRWTSLIGLLAGLLVYQPAHSAVLTFDEFLPDPSVLGSVALGFTQSPVYGATMYLPRGGAIQNVAIDGGSDRNAFLETTYFGIGGDNKSTACCLISIHSFDLKAHNSEDVGKTIRLGVDLYGIDHFIYIELQGEFTHYAFDFPAPIRVFVIGGAPEFAIDNVSFDTIQGVPEPTSWMLQIAGFYLAGLGLRSARCRRIWL